MKCEIVKPKEAKEIEKVCNRCGFKTNNPLITVCPRCMAGLPGFASCSGGCSSCHLSR